MTSTESTTGTTGESGAPELRRVLGPKLLLLFIVGDMLGTGIYALTGRVAEEVGGAVWLPFLVAFAIAVITAFAYLELVTKYPKAGGAASFVHRAFDLHFLTFLVTFAVMASGITSASTAAKAFASNLAAGLDLDWGPESIQVLGIAVAFMLVLALINFRGVSESVKLNVVLTLVELSGLLLIIFVGLWAVLGFSDAEVDLSRAVMFDSAGDKNAFLAVTAATSLAFFAMVGFEDSVNMAEEVKNPSKIFPKVMLTGLGFTIAIYLLVSLTSVALVPIGELGEGETPLLTVVERGAPNLPIDTFYPFIAMFAVANTALINMLMASRLLYGMAHQGVLPKPLGMVHRGRRTPWMAIVVTTLFAVALILVVGGISELGGTTALLLLAVFTVVNAAVLVLRRDPVDHDHFRAPTWVPVVGVLTCAYMVGPWTGRAVVQYQIAGWVLGVGVLLWAVTWFLNRALYARPTRIKDPHDLADSDELHRRS
ncbi:APC family permease [Ornithinimicrobium humiphilum]|uniref:Amino acid/polyamine/organocation transporter (APC superfamily) n=1 Tax=Ornithinimicrobium humiphilum TaxID=125288 RepID=A0A543KN59_9MICO|nr:APC family permease [Ornithinimicrobium humiphilum]TQM96512.1 amino acid/polyamine/organocation transporter (APC superfamily) [Ornithinimicrobium humiphilum]